MCVLVIPVFSACSLAFVEGPPVGYERFDPVPCTSSKVFPILDAAFSAVSFWAGGMLALEEVTDFQDDIGKHLGVSKTGAMVTMFATGVAGGYSAYKGFNETKACREAMLEVQARNRDVIAKSQGQASQPTESPWRAPFFPAPVFGVGPSILPDTIP